MFIKDTIYLYILFCFEHIVGSSTSPELPVPIYEFSYDQGRQFSSGITGLSYDLPDHVEAIDEASSSVESDLPLPLFGSRLQDQQCRLSVSARGQVVPRIRFFLVVWDWLPGDAWCTSSPPPSPLPSSPPLFHLYSNLVSPPPPHPLF